jgi:hypothetical protein
VDGGAPAGRGPRRPPASGLGPGPRVAGAQSRRPAGALRGDRGAPAAILRSDCPFCRVLRPNCHFIVTRDGSLLCVPPRSPTGQSTQGCSWLIDLDLLALDVLEHRMSPRALRRYVTHLVDGLGRARRTTKGLSKIKLAHSCGILLAHPAWRNRHGTHGLTQVAVHRNSEIPQGQCPTAVYGPHRLCTKNLVSTPTHRSIRPF